MRARNIKPDFYRDAELAECSCQARYIVPGLWMMADREGRIIDKPKQIKMNLFPCDEWDCDALLEELANASHIIRYQVNGSRFIQVRNFKKHQKCHPNEPASTIPEMPMQKQRGNEHSCNVTPCHEHSCNVTSDPADCLNADILNAECLNAEGCPEPSQASGPPPTRARADAEPVCTIPTNRHATCGEEFIVTPEFACELQELYPALDVYQELKNIRAWNLTNPTRRKTLSGIPKHINAWLAKEQNRGNGRHPPGQQPKLVSKVTERNMAVIQAARAMEAQHGKT